MPEAARPPLGVAKPGPRLGQVWAPRGPLRLVFWLRESSGEIWTLRYFPGIFLKVGFLHKNETPEQFC